MDDVVVTLDVDWAPDFVIDFVAELLLARRVRATWFLTHQSPATLRLSQYRDEFELGLHPNFLPGSSHGDSPEEVLRYCMAIAPDAASVRMHGLVQSSPLLELILAQTPLKTDVSLFLPHAPHLQPVEYVWQGRSLLRIPFVWEDDDEMERMAPCWHLAPLLTLGEGLKVVNFHPIHVFLNSSNMQPYKALKRRVPQLADATPGDVAGYVQDGEGGGTFFAEVIDYLSQRGKSSTITDIHERWYRSLQERWTG